MAFMARHVRADFPKVVAGFSCRRTRQNVLTAEAAVRRHDVPCFREALCPCTSKDGRLNMKPCTSEHPSAVRKSIWEAVSTPSARTEMSSDEPSASMARTKAFDWRSFPSADVKDLSSLIRSNGNERRVSKEE